MEFLFLFVVFGIDAVVTQHFKVFFRDVNNESFNEVEGGNTLFDGLVVFVAGVVKSNIFSIIFINA